MAANPHNVDICVTCICDKPPQLPLREELPSLGIEVVYNAKGVGVEASKKELRKERERIHRQKVAAEILKKSKKERDRSSRSRRSTLNPPGFLSKKFGNKGKKKQDPPEDLAIPKALSYGSYQRTLDIRTKEDAKSVTSSIETTPSMDEKNRTYMKKKKKLAQRMRGLFSQKKEDPNHPPKSVEFPNLLTLEEAALEEAFNAFMADEEDIDIPSKPKDINLSRRKSNGKKELFPDLLPGGKDNPEQVEKHDIAKKTSNKTKEVTDSSSSGVDQTTVSSLGNDSSILNKNLFYDAEAFSKQVQDRLSKLTTDHGKSPVDVDKGVGSGGNIRVKLLGNRADDHITEIYDLTEISEAGNDNSPLDDRRRLLSPTHHDVSGTFQDNDLNDVLCHGSTEPISPYATKQNDQSEFSEQSSVPVPQMRDAFGRNILDVSNVYEENGPGSPLLLSPVPLHSNSYVDLYSSSFDAAEYRQEKKERNPYLPSFDSNPMRDNEFVQDGRDDIVVYRAEDDMSLSFRERNLSPVKLEIASSYRAPTKRALLALAGSDRSKTIPKKYSRRFDEPTRPKETRQTFSPSIKNNASRDSYESLKSPKVSFSEDIEERRYFKKEKFEYEKSMADVKSSLAAVVNESRDLTDPLPSALSREADEAFQSFADQLDVKEKPRTPEQMLLEALSYGDPLPFDYEETIKLNPSITSQRLPDIGTTALHSACLRAFPKRFTTDQSCRVMDLVHDLHLHRKLVEALVAANCETCRKVDRNGDLPVHIMARHLMEWESQWYQKVYSRATGNDDDQDSGAGITKLYQSMSECVNILLEPIIGSDTLCRRSGSVGRILPLHIAAIFTVPYNTLRSLLEAFPNAASMKCDLSNTKTFVPNNSTPLELHDRLSTDFPRWEIQRHNVEPGEKMTQSMIDKVYKTTNGIRRSDLIFAFSPKLLPFRKEAHRIRRMENMIQNEMKKQEQDDKFVLSHSAEMFWIWLCEFQDHDDASDHYAASVSRIVDPLSFHSVRFLASVLNGRGNPVLDEAVPSCADAIMKRLDTISKTHVSMRVPSNLHIAAKSSLLNQFDEDTSKRFHLHGRGLVGPLCRSIFNITETAYPSSFVVLPYKLVKDNEGRLGLESPEAAKAAMKFAEFLSTLTMPKNIIGTLDQKIEETIGQNIVDKMNRASRESRRKHFTEFLKLYENEPAYFYFIDDYSGIPIVDESRGIYPLIISDAAEMVEKVFPMMLSGMILMRGEKSISILTDVLLDDSIKVVLPHWIEAAKDLISFTLSPNGDSTKLPLNTLLPLQDRLIDFVQYGPTEYMGGANKLTSHGLSNEWVVEISLIKMILEMHDPRHYFCNLSEARATSQVMWTQDSRILKGITNRIDFIPFQALKDTLFRGSERLPQKLTRGNEVSEDKVLEEGFVAIDETDDNKNNDRTMTDSDYTSGEYTDSSSDDQMPGMIITTTESKISEDVKSDEMDHMGDSESYTNEEPPESSLDDSFNRDSFFKLRLKLDEQEAKLYSLRQKISYLDSAGDELEQGEEKITNMIDEVINQRDILNVPSKDGLEKAKALLRRICELEDRVLCREVEVGQLKNNVSFFQLEASNHSGSRRLEKKMSSSSHRGSTDSEDESSEPLNRDRYQIPEKQNEAIRIHDTDIESMASGHVRNLNQVEALNAEDDSTAGNSTMYNSSIDGYSAGFSAGMSRH